MLAIVLFAGTATADIHITVYGKGGIIVHPDGTQQVCPDPGTKVCAEISLPSLNSMNDELSNGGIQGILTYKGISQNVTILELPNLREENGGYGCQGAVFQTIK